METLDIFLVVIQIYHRLIHFEYAITITISCDIIFKCQLKIMSHEIALCYDYHVLTVKNGAAGRTDICQSMQNM